MTASDLQRTVRAEGLPWAVFGDRDGFRAERLGSVRREVFHASGDVLLELIRDSEARMPGVVQVSDGLANL